MIENYISCNTSPLSIFVPSAQNPWDAEKVRHLHNRLSFAIAPALLANALASSPENYVDSLIDAAINLPATTEPGWAALDPVDYAANGYTYGEDENRDLIEETQSIFTKDLIDNGTRGRMSLFWHNHLVTIANDYNFAGYAFRYFQLLERNCLGNFRTFVSEMGLSGAMLKFLNGFENEAGSPNENYARELYELFSLGEGNGYTEDDIVETSRALTGYNVYSNGDDSRILYNEDTFDANDKTIFGQTGNWGYDDVINILFDQKSQLIARFICEKIYINFVSPEIDDTIRLNIVNPLADIFIANNFEIAPVLRTLFKSEHFYDAYARNVIIKSPFDLGVHFITATGFDYGPYDDLKVAIRAYTNDLGQEILYPPTVAGWEGNKDWINSGVFTLRQIFLCKDLVIRAWEQDQEQFRQFGKDVSEVEDDVEIVVKSIFEALMTTIPYTLDDFENGLDVFKSRVPSNYFEQDIWNMDFESATLQVRDLLEFIVSLPDYQLK